MKRRGLRSQSSSEEGARVVADDVEQPGSLPCWAGAGSVAGVAVVAMGVLVAVEWCGARGGSFSDPEYNLVIEDAGESWLHTAQCTVQ